MKRTRETLSWSWWGQLRALPTFNIDASSFNDINPLVAAPATLPLLETMEITGDWAGNQPLRFGGVRPKIDQSHPLRSFTVEWSTIAEHIIPPR